MSKEPHAPWAGIGASAPYATHAARVIEGEAKAADYLARLQAQQIGPDELASIVASMHDAMLRGFARVIEKALRGASHA